MINPCVGTEVVSGTTYTVCDSPGPEEWLGRFLEELDAQSERSDWLRDVVAPAAIRFAENESEEDQPIASDLNARLMLAQELEGHLRRFQEECAENGAVQLEELFARYLEDIGETGEGAAEYIREATADQSDEEQESLWQASDSKPPRYFNILASVLWLDSVRSEWENRGQPAVSYSPETDTATLVAELARRAMAGELDEIHVKVLEAALGLERGGDQHDG